MKELKKFQKRTFGIATTGIGLGVLAGVSPDANTSLAIGKAGKGLGMMSNLAVLDLGMGTLSNMQKKMKKNTPRKKVKKNYFKSILQNIRFSL